LAAVACADDLYLSLKSADKLPDDEVPVLTNFENYVVKKFPKLFKLPKKPYETVIISIGLVGDKYQRCGLGKGLAKNFCECHPLMAQAKTVMVECEGYPAKKMAEFSGFQQLIALPYEKLAKVKGLEEFKYLH